MTLVERDAAVSTALGYLRDAADGHGRVLFVAGEAGVGKTTFVGAVMDRAATVAHVAAGACDGSSTPPPLGPLVEMLPALPVSVWPVDRRSDVGPSARTQLFARLVDSLRAPADTKPFLLLVEDAHWADEATLDLLRHLARRIHTCRALVLVTYRPEDVTPGHPLRTVLGDVATGAGTRRLDLPPLTTAGIARLVEELAAGDPRRATPDVERLHRVTGGNAFFVTEVLAAGTDDVPDTVRDAVLARTARLSSPARHVLDIVAVAGARTEIDVLESLLGADDLDALDEAAERGVLVTADGDVMFRHELARLAVADQVPAFRRIALHRRMLAELTLRSRLHDVDPARLAHHADGASDGAAVLEHAPRAASRAASLGAHREAAEQYRRALRYSGPLAPSERAELLGLLAYECYLTDGIEEASAARAEALAIWVELGDAVRVGASHRWLSRLSWFAGRGTDAVEHGRSAVEALETGRAGPDPAADLELASAYSNMAQLSMLGSRLDDTRLWSGLALSCAAGLPPGIERTAVEVHAANNLGTAEISSGDAVLGLRLLRSSLEDARAADLQEHAARAYCNLVSTSLTEHRHQGAERLLADGIEYTAERDLDSWMFYLLGWKAEHLLDVGDPDGLEAVTRRLLRQRGVAPVSLVTPLLAVARSRARRGVESWQEPLDRAIALAESTGEAQRIGPAAVARSEIAWLSGDLSGSTDLAERAWPLVASGGSGWTTGALAVWHPHLVGSSPEVVAPPYALELAGRWGESAARWEELGCHHERGMVLARSGDRSAMQQAAGVFDALGASASASRVRAGMRENGWTVPAAPRRSAGPAGLTARELDVLALLRAGLSDAAIAQRLVLSRRTVEHHVAAILAKLAVPSRRDVEQASARLGIDPQPSG